MKSKYSKRSARKKTQNKSVTLAVFSALFINALVLPGLGTIIAGRIKEGATQLLLCLMGTILGIAGFILLFASPLAASIFVLLGIILFISGWGWAIMSGIVLLTNRQR